MDKDDSIASAELKGFQAMHEGFSCGRLWISICSPMVWLLAYEQPVTRSAYSGLFLKHGTQPNHSAPSTKPSMLSNFPCL